MPSNGWFYRQVRELMDRTTSYRIRRWDFATRIPKVRAKSRTCKVDAVSGAVHFNRSLELFFLSGFDNSSNFLPVAQA
jgi:hypothetical protein